ncbi:unnamed protein product, partial [Rotaria sp. Silwood2]
EDEPRAGRPRTAVTPENIEAVRELVNIDPHITYQQIEDTLQIGSTSTEIILHDYLGLKNVTCRWVPHSLSEAQKQDRVDYCLQMLKKFDGGKSKRVYDIITSDESWFYYYDPETKRQSQVWVASNDPHPTKVRRQRSVGKHMFANFLMKSGFNTIIPLENGKTVTAKWYANECLTQVLKKVEKHRRLNDLLIHHDNAPAHRAALTMEYLDIQHVKLMGHPAYSPDLSPCDFWLFPKIKEQLRGKNFQDINELDDAVRTQIDCLQKDDFYQCYEKWFERMNKCISAQGHYFEQI